MRALADEFKSAPEHEAVLPPTATESAPDNLDATIESSGAPTAGAPEQAEILPDGVRTNDIAAAFNGVYWDITRWKKYLQDRPPWLRHLGTELKLSPGRPGGLNPLQATWNPVVLARALLLSCKRWCSLDFDQKQRKLSDAFGTRSELAEWRKLWRDELSRHDVGK